MKMEELGTNTFIWLKKCKGSQVCVDLPYYGGIIGACSIKVRSHYDGESCANNNKCTSGVCDGTKCKGKTEGQNCEPGLGQCKKGLLCRCQLDSDGNTLSNFICQKPIDDGGKCDNDYFSGKYINGEYVIFNDDYFFDPAQNPCKLGSVCEAVSEKCVKIGTIDNGVTVSNPLACKTGLVKKNPGPNIANDPNDYSYTCEAAIGDTRTTSLGAEYEIGSNTTDAFKDWLTEVGKNNMKDEHAIYEAYRYTRKKKKINKAWFIYTHHAFVKDADECAFDYLWKQSSSNYIQFSLIILIFTLLF
jgi:hypothetical protein